MGLLSTLTPPVLCSSPPPVLGLSWGRALELGLAGCLPEGVPAGGWGAGVVLVGSVGSECLEPPGLKPEKPAESRRLGGPQPGAPEPGPDRPWGEGVRRPPHPHPVPRCSRLLRLLPAVQPGTGAPRSLVHKVKLGLTWGGRQGRAALKKSEDTQEGLGLREGPPAPARDRELEGLPPARSPQQKDHLEVGVIQKDQHPPRRELCCPLLPPQGHGEPGSQPSPVRPPGAS